MNSGVYFAQAGDMVKIGWSNNIPSRLVAIRNSCPAEVVLLRTIPTADRQLERTLHKRFAHLRVRLEWFSLRDELCAFIEAEIPLASEQHAGDPRTEAVRATLAQAIERLGGFTATAAACGLTEYSIRNWLKAGCLNNVSVEPALKFAHAVKIPLDDFVVKD